MRKLICLSSIFALALPLTAASIQIIVRNDGGTIKEDITITVNPTNGTGNDALLAIQDWRDSQLDNADPPQPLFPDTQAGRDAFWRATVIPPLKRMVLQFPWADLAAKKAISDSTATADTNTELGSAFQ